MRHNRGKTLTHEGPTFEQTLRETDCDIIEMMYIVYASVKHTTSMTGVNSPLEKGNNVDERKRSLINYCLKHVVHKRLFQLLLQQAQSRRRLTKGKDVSWYDRENVAKCLSDYNTNFI